jgi:hypothetical protein
MLSAKPYTGDSALLNTFYGLSLIMSSRPAGVLEGMLIVMHILPTSKYPFVGVWQSMACDYTSAPHDSRKQRFPSPTWLGIFRVLEVLELAVVP